MSVSILAEQDRLSLGNGMNLRLLSAWELLDARREARQLAQNPQEQALCSNACLVARALAVDGEEQFLFADGKQVLEALTAEEIEALAERWDTFRRRSVPRREEYTEQGVNPNFDDGRFAQGVKLE